MARRSRFMVQSYLQILGLLRNPIWTILGEPRTRLLKITKNMMNGRNVVNFAAIMALGLTLLPGSAISQQNPLKDQIVGRWLLVYAWVERDGKITQPLGPSSIGYIAFDSTGHYSYHFMRPDVPKFASNNRATGTPDENKAVVLGNIATFGTYTINPDNASVTLHIVGSSFPNWIGTDQKRLIEISGDGNRLKYTNPEASIDGVAPSIYIRAK